MQSVTLGAGVALGLIGLVTGRSWLAVLGIVLLALSTRRRRRAIFHAVSTVLSDEPEGTGRGPFPRHTEDGAPPGSTALPLGPGDCGG